MGKRSKFEKTLPLWRTVRQFLKKLNVAFPCDPAIPLLGMDPRELKTGTRTDTWTLMFVTAQFTVAKR